MKPPAARYVSSIRRFHATTVPKAAASGQNGRPNGQPPKLTRGLDSGWNVYGSRHGARAVVELMADEPEVVDGLQMVAARRLAAGCLRASGERESKCFGAGHIAASPAAR